MPEPEPVELTIKKLDLAWNISTKTSTSGYTADNAFDAYLERVQKAYRHIHETLYGEDEQHSG